MKLLRPTGFHHKVAISMALLLLFQTIFPVAAFALTSGPTQPEFNEFEPVGTTQMVDLFSGDFTYNIPLFELPGPDGGYPFNLSYHSGITMDQEATWVGLGWSMNHGAINRTMRGFPDDFNGDKIERKLDMKPNRTWKFGIGFQTQAFAKDLISIKLGLNVMHNNYKGWGLGLNVAPNINMLKQDGFGYTAGLSLNVDSFDGASLSPSFSLGSRNGDITSSLNLGLSINSREGAQALTLGVSASNTKEIKKDDSEVERSSSSSIGSNQSYSFGKTAYSPQIGTEFNGINLTGSFELGGTPFLGIGLGPEVSAAFYGQKLKDKDVWKSTPAYGYLNLEESLTNPKALMDFNREKDGPLYGSTPNLPVPISTPDVYTVTGQGAGGSYRPYRSNVGVFKDPAQRSISGGGRIGADFNFGNTADGGVDFGGNFAISLSGNGKLGNGAIANKFGFNKSNGSSLFEPYYFKSAGEITAELIQTDDQNNLVYPDSYMGGKEAARLSLGSRSILAGRHSISNSTGDGYEKRTVLNDGSLSEIKADILDTYREDRKPRSTSIQTITNEELLSAERYERPSELLGVPVPPIPPVEHTAEYKLKYYEASSLNNASFNPLTSTLEDYLRDEDAIHPDHIAGIASLQPNGMRYVYGLPVKNKTQEEMIFSVNASSHNLCSPLVNLPANTTGDFHKTGVAGSDDYLNHSKIPEYTHTHLLTSVLGPDYVDLDDIPGPSNGDYGYWVKFNYVKTSDNFKWRAPFFNANFQPGSLTVGKDDKGHITYGEKEQFYLATAETRTHKAVFHISDRADGRGVSTFYQKSNSNKGAYSYQLDKISLYSKLELENSTTPVPIKEVHFDFKANNESLCQEIPNGVGGKLTLDKVHFTYQNSTRGSLSPYEFDYNGLNTGSSLGDYSDLQFDRWGTYRSSETCLSNGFPYTIQSNKTTLDEEASMWHLNKIKLPSGAFIKVNYEIDDYAYVQDRKAMQMYKLAPDGSGQINEINEINTSDSPSTDDLKVYFDPGEDNGEDICDFISELHGVKKNGSGDCDFDFTDAQLYFKIKVNLKNQRDTPPPFEFVSGYADVVGAGEDTEGYYVQLAPVSVKGGSFHPFALTAWQKLKMEFPDKIREGDSVADLDPDNFLEAISSFTGAIKEIGAIFKKYYKVCSANNYGSEIKWDESMIRLNSPDGIKYGGGVRVKQVTLDDNWDVNGNNTEDDRPTYGQVYNYTTESENSAGDPIVISSGVAANEPSTGGDESALRFAKKWKVESRLKSNQNLFFEYPFNENYYPGPSVGYSKVTVKSLATALASTDYVDPVEDHIGQSFEALPSGYGTTGVTINEFYTAKDFPTLIEETELDSRENGLSTLPINPVNISVDIFTGSQGYAITLNDMHGKPFRTTHFGQDNQGAILSQPLSKVTYTYSEDEEEVYTVAGNVKRARVLNNNLKVLWDEASPTNAAPNPNADIRTAELGVDYDFLVDARESSSHSGELNFGINVEFTTPFLFGFGAYPQFSLNNSITKTYVTNKIIRKSGILLTTEAFLLTTVNNSFADVDGNPDKIYNYNIPARLAYERMGAAYENWGAKFEVLLGADESCGLFTMEPTGITTDYQPVSGDELMVTNFIDNADCDEFTSLCSNRIYTFVGKKEIDGDQIFLLENENLTEIISTQRAEVMVLRSGKRNHLTAKSGSVTALSNPTDSRSATSFQSVTVDMPSGETQESLISVTTIKMNDVLNASAVTYSDMWDLERFTSETENFDIYVPGCNERTLHYLDIDYNHPDFTPGNVFIRAYINTDVIEDNANDLNCPPAIPGERFGGVGPSFWSANFDYACSVLLDSNEGVEVTGCLGHDDIYCAFLACTAPDDIEDIFPIVIFEGSLNRRININGPNDLAAFPEIGITVSHFSETIPCDDDWYCPTGFSNIEFQAEGTRANTKYKYGEHGIWRPFQNYTYVKERNSSIDLSSSPPGDVPSGNGEEVENRDIIGLHSSALYAYKDNLPIAVAANANHYEIAFESFETLENEEEKGNLDFYCTNNNTEDKTVYINNTYQIHGGYEGGDFILIDKLAQAQNLFTPNNTFALLILQDQFGNEFEATAVIDNIVGAGINNVFGKELCQLQLSDIRPECDIDLSQTTSTGKIVIKQEKEIAYLAGGCNGTVPKLSSTWAHTGEKSIEVPISSGFNFNQASTELQPGKTYVISAWASLGEDFDGHTLEDQVKINLDPDGGASGFVNEFRPSGPIIDGWQRIEHTFVAEEGATNQDGFWRIGFANSNDQFSAFFDDIRIYPLDGNIQSYVYDLTNYRLKAVLDNNNYATFYNYDEEGNLFLVKKETAEGIKTIQETREYVKAN